MRKHARAAKEMHVLAQLLASLPAIPAAAAGMRRTHRDLVAGLDARDAGTGRDDDSRRLVPGNQRLAHDETAVSSVLEIVEIGAADAARTEGEQHLSHARNRRLLRLDAQVFFRVNATGEHLASSY